MYNKWIDAYNSFNWVVDLTKYRDKNSYPVFFNSKIDLKNLNLLEKKFQNAINNPENNFDERIVAGEILFWKLNSKRDVNTKTSDFIRHLSYIRQDKAIVWEKFAESISSLSKEPTFENFNNFCNLCNMPSGYALPITFLSFYDPAEYPIADRRIAKWWHDNKDKFGYKESTNFLTTEDGGISGSFYNREANWNTYLQWTDFCRKCAKKLTTLTNFDWTPRMVEIAVWTAAGSDKISLEPLDKPEDNFEGDQDNLVSNEKKPTKSPVLILFIDSFHKLSGGSSEYDLKNALINSIDDEAIRSKFIKTRDEILSNLSNNEIHWYKCEQEIEKYNNYLVKGRDFGGQTPANYLPAIKRFDGQFYKELGEEGKSGILSSNHHFMILSACYGLLLPKESIQNYACQFGQKNSAYYLWTKSKLITEVMAEYIRKNNIKRIFDFTYCDVISYHFSIDWEYLKENTNIDVIHCYHSLAEGDKALRDFGKFIKDHILSRKASELLEMKTGIIDNIVLSPKIEVKDTDDSLDVTVENLINIGECETIEFKKGVFRSAKYDGYPGFVYDDDPNFIFEKNNSMFSIAKTIVAFLNTNGGTLLIGVEELKEEGDICKTHSITNEYSKLQDKNLDGYKRKIIDDIIDKMIYPKDIITHFSKYLNISFEEVKGDTVCRIHVKKSDIPFYAIAFYNNERQKAHFYKRTDSETREVYFQFTGEYILKHFCKKN